MKLASDNKKTLIILAILIVANTALLIGAILINRRIDAQSKTINEQVGTLNKRNLSTENLRDSLARIKTVGNRIENFDQYLFSPGEELALITDLENMALKNKIAYKIGSSNLDNYTDNRLDIELSLSGLLTNMIKYVNDLESYKYVISIRRMEFSPSGAVSQENSAQVNANLRLLLSLYAKPAK
jgi:Tfp pilus assembly protein PilO